MLTPSFIVIFICSDYSAQALARYPIVSDCSLLIGADDPAKMEKGAILEYTSNHALEEQGNYVSYSKGYVVCFCDEKALAGDEPEKLYGSNDQPVCEDYINQIFPTMLITNGIMVVIIGINLILKYSIIYLITWIGTSQWLL